MNEHQLLEILKKHRWSIQGFNGMPLYLDCAASESGWITNRRFGPAYSHFFYLYSKGRAYMYYDEADWERMCDLFYAEVKNDEGFAAVEREYTDDYRTYEAASAYDSATLGQLSEEELLALAQRLFLRLTYAAGIGHIIEGVTFGSEQRLKAALARSGPVNEMEFSTLCSPATPSFLSHAQKKLWEIRNAEDKGQLIDVYLREFGWVQTTYLGPRFLTADDVRAQADALGGPPSETDYAALAAEKAALVDTYALTSEERFVVHIIERCFAWQDDRKMYLLQSVAAIEPVLIEIARRYSIELMPLKFATTREFTLAKLTDSAFRAELEERCKKSAVYVTEQGYLIFVNGAFDTIAAGMHVSMEDGVKELRGVVASKGIARGKARICDSVSDIDKFQEGDVLVASMTRPEYLPAMQKAIAFVTNEGGVTCHAAIISREMKKPCIIGTKNATQILKDGDMVEVDANKGVVRKI